MSIIIQGYHGPLTGNQGTKIVRVLDVIARNEIPSYKWVFNGSLGQFADSFQFNFLVYRGEMESIVFVTQHNSFGAR